MAQQSLSQALAQIPTPSTAGQLVKQNGQLLQTTTQEAQTLTGMPISSPSQASSMGLNKDQAKMAGSSAQKTNALRQAIQGQMDLSTRQREQQTLGQSTDQSTAEVQKAQAAQNLGDLQSRVQQISAQKIQQAVGGLASQPINVSQLDTSKVQNPTVKTALDAIKQNPNDQGALANLAIALGKQPGEALTQDDINNALGGASGLAAAAGNTAAAAVSAKPLTVSDLPPEMQQSATSLLGPGAANMSTQQLIDAVNQEKQAEFSKTQQTEAKLNNPYVGAAERAEARSQLKDLGVTGIESAEGSVDQLADKIKNADTVSFNGQDMQVEDLLNDQYVSGLVANYIQDPTSPTSQTLAKTEPDLTKLVDQYKPIFQTAVNSLGAGAAEFSATQLSNQNLNQVDLGNGQTTKLSDDVMKTLMPGYGQIQGTKLNLNQSGVLSFLGDFSKPGDQKQAVVNAVTQLQGLNPSFVQEMSKWSPQQIQQNLVQDAPRVNALINQYSQVSKIDPAHTNPDQVAQAFGFKDGHDMQTQVTSSMRKVNSGLYAPVDLNKMGIILDKQGNVDWSLSLDRLKRSTPNTLTDLIASGKQAASDQTAASIINQKTTDTKGIADKVGAAIADHGAITTNDMKTIGPTLGVDDISHILDNSKVMNYMDSPAKAAMTTQYHNMLDSKVDDQVQSSATKTGVTTLSGLLSNTSNPPKSTDEANNNMADLQSSISNLQDVSRQARSNGETSNEHYIDQKITSLQNRLSGYQSQVSGVQTNVNNDADLAAKKYAGAQSFSDLVSNINPNNINQASTVLSGFQNDSRKARDSGDHLTEQYYDDKIQSLQGAIETAKGSHNRIYNESPPTLVQDLYGAGERAGPTALNPAGVVQKLSQLPKVATSSTLRSKL